MHFKNLLTLSVVALLIVACGKKGSPKPPEAYAPPPVSSLSAEGAVDSITIKWRAPILLEDDVKREPVSFLVMKQLEEESFDELGTIDVPVDEDGVPLESGFAFTDTNVEPGKKYNYSVVPVNRDGVKGAAPNVASVTFIGESSVVEVR